MPRKPTRYTVCDGNLVLTLELADEGGYIVTSPFDPGLITEAETFEMARDAAAALRTSRRRLNRRSGSS